MNNDIDTALEADGSDWAAKQLAVLRTKSPQTLKVAFRQLRRGAERFLDVVVHALSVLVDRLVAQCLASLAGAGVAAGVGTQAARTLASIGLFG